MFIRDYGQTDKCVESWFKREDLKAQEKDKTCEDSGVGYDVTFTTIYVLSPYAQILVDQGKEKEALAIIDEVKKWQDYQRLCTQGGEELRARVDYYETMGLVNARIGSREKALEAVAGIRRTSDDKVHPIDELMIKLSRGQIYLALSMYEEVLREVDYSFDFTQYFGLLENGYEHYTWLFMKANSLFKTGRYSEAKAVYSKLMAMPGISTWGSFYYMALYDLSQISVAEGSRGEAIDYLLRAVAVIEAQRSTVLTESGKIGFVGDKQQVYFDLVTLLVEQGNLDEALEYVERSKSRTLVDMLAEKKKFLNKNSTEKTVTLLAELNRIDHDARAMGQLPPEAFGKKRGGKGSKNKEILLAIENISPEFSSLVSVKALSSAGIQGKLRKDETLLEFYGNAEFLLAFIVTQENIEFVKFEADSIYKGVAHLREAVLEYDSARYLKRGASLYQSLFALLTPYIKTKDLTIVAHGPLHYLPFNALHDGDSFLIDKYSIRMLPSASVMEFLGKNSNKGDSMLVLANPDLGNAEYDLPAAEKEGQAIAQGKDNAKVLSRRAATETALRKYGAVTSRLHIASHGQFNAEAPLKSRLLLATDGANDGNLTVDELYNLELNNDLVVLSACETGLGDVKNGDDVIGLTRGFLFAGADSIVSSLWVVDDTATANLMVAFYDGLENNSKQEALRQAQLKIKNEYNDHPFFWAAFQLTGSM